MTCTSNTKKRVLSALTDFRKRGYLQISASELAYATRLPRRAVIASLHASNLHTVLRHGELFVEISNEAVAPRVLFSDLALKSAIFSEVD